MKISELRNTVERGSQKKRANHPTATDKPEKYIGKWERYDSAQGVNSKDAKKQMHAEDIDGFTTRFAPSQMTLTGDYTSMTDKNAVKKSKRAPMKVIRKAVKSTFKTPIKNIDETIRHPLFTDLTADYEVNDAQRVVGFASVVNGVITRLAVQDDASENYEGHILNALIGNIIREADHINANLSVKITPEQSNGMIKFLERFGFRHIKDRVMRRNAGAIRPPSVPYNRGLDGK